MDALLLLVEDESILAEAAGDAILGTHSRRRGIENRLTGIRAGGSTAQVLLISRAHLVTVGEDSGGLEVAQKSKH